MPMMRLALVIWLPSAVISDENAGCAPIVCEDPTLNQFCAYATLLARAVCRRTTIAGPDTSHIARRRS